MPRKQAAPEQIAKTWAELAKALGMPGRDPERTLKRLGTRDDFPGRPGRPGQRDGHFPVETIRAWLATVRGSVQPAGDDELAAAARRCKLLELESRERQRLQEMGELLDVEEVAAWCETVVANSRAVLEGLPDQVLGLLPAAIAAGTRVEIHQAAGRVVATALDELRQLIGGDGEINTDRDSTPTASRRARAASGRRSGGVVRGKRPAKRRARGGPRTV